MYTEHQGISIILNKRSINQRLLIDQVAKMIA